MNQYRIMLKLEYFGRLVDSTEIEEMKDTQYTDSHMTHSLFIDWSSWIPKLIRIYPFRKG